MRYCRDRFIRPGVVRHVTVVAGVAACVIVAACSSTSTVPVFDGSLPLGTWGGDNTGMIVGDTAMHLHVACTFGDVSGRVPLGANGQFDVAGSYMLRAYPITVGPSVPARFVGRVDGAKATITVTVNDTVEHKTVVLGPVVLTWGAEPQMGPCPICRRPIVTRQSRSAALWSRVRSLAELVASKRSHILKLPR
jgi:hypothetical protein